MNETYSDYDYGQIASDVPNATEVSSSFTAEKLESEVKAAEAKIIPLETGRGRASTPKEDWSYGPPLSEWLGDDEPDDDDSSDWFVRGLIPRDVPFFVAGDPKTGKTMLTEAWAIALATGAETWCGYAIYGRRRVLLMPREDAARTTKKRLWQLARGAGLNRPHDLDEWLSIDPTNPMDLGKPEHCKKLRDACVRFDVVLIDSFATSHHGDENATRDMSNVMGAIRDISFETNTAIGFIHHFNGKGNNANDKRSPIHRLRGASALAGFARHVVGVQRGKEKDHVAIDADGNFEYRPEPFVVQLVNSELAGKRRLHYELVGDAREVSRDSENRVIDEAIIAALRHGPENVRGLRGAANAVLKDGPRGGGVRPQRIDARADELCRQGKIACSNSGPKGEKLWSVRK